MSTRRHFGAVNGGLTGAGTLPPLRAALAIEPPALPIWIEGHCTGLARCFGLFVGRTPAAVRFAAGGTLCRIEARHGAVAGGLLPAADGVAAA